MSKVLREALHHRRSEINFRQDMGCYLDNNMKILHVPNRLVGDLYCSLRLGDGEAPIMDVFPELQELSYSANDDTGDAFTAFIDMRQDAGHPVTLVRH